MRQRRRQKGGRRLAFPLCIASRHPCGSCVARAGPDNPVRSGVTIHKVQSVAKRLRPSRCFISGARWRYPHGDRERRSIGFLRFRGHARGEHRTNPSVTNWQSQSSSIASVNARGSANVVLSPTTIAVGPLMRHSLSQFSSYVPKQLLTGIGLVAQMNVGGSASSYDGAQILESMYPLEESPLKETAKAGPSSFQPMNIMLRSRHSRQFNMCGTRICLTNL